MLKRLIAKGLIAVLCIFIISTTSAGNPSSKIRNEILKTLDQWNTASKNAELDKFMALFDDSENILLVGSAKGEVYKGKVQIREWLSQLYGFAGFSWEMNSVEIDANKNTAWVFVEGFMVVKPHKGEARKTPYRFTGILVKKGGEWKWRLFNGSVPQQE